MDFLKKLSRRERALVVAASVFILLAIAYRLVMIPVRDSNAAMDTGIGETKSKLDILETVAYQKKGVDAEYDRYQQVFEGVGTDKEQIAMFQEKLEDFCTRIGVLLVQIRPRNAKTTEWSKTYFVEVTIEAEKEQLMSFLHRLNTAEEAFRVDTLQLAGKEKGSQRLKAHMLVSKQIFVQNMAAK